MWRIAAFAAMMSVAASGGEAATGTPPASDPPAGAVFDPVYNFSPPAIPTVTPAPTQDRAGAKTVIAQYRMEWEKAATKTANGRKDFEIPAFIAAAGSLIATAVGAKPWVAIAGGGVALAGQAGSAYFAPKPKAALYISALAAVRCIESYARTAARVPEVDGLGSDQFEYESLVGGVENIDLVLREALSKSGDGAAAKSLMAAFGQSLQTSRNTQQKIEKLQGARNDAILEQKIMEAKNEIALRQKGGHALFASNELTEQQDRIDALDDQISEADAVKARAEFEAAVQACMVKPGA